MGLYFEGGLEWSYSEFMRIPNQGLILGRGQ